MTIVPTIYCARITLNTVLRFIQCHVWINMINSSLHPFGLIIALCGLIMWGIWPDTPCRMSHSLVFYDLWRPALLTTEPDHSFHWALPCGKQGGRGIYRRSVLICCKTSVTWLLHPFWNENWVHYHTVIISRLGLRAWAPESWGCQESEQRETGLGWAKGSRCTWGPALSLSLSLGPRGLGSGERVHGLKQQLEAITSLV